MITPKGPKPPQHPQPPAASRQAHTSWTRAKSLPAVTFFWLWRDPVPGGGGNHSTSLHHLERKHNNLYITPQPFNKPTPFTRPISLTPINTVQHHPHQTPQLAYLAGAQGDLPHPDLVPQVVGVSGQLDLQASTGRRLWDRTLRLEMGPHAKSPGDLHPYKLKTPDKQATLVVDLEGLEPTVWQSTPKIHYNGQSTPKTPSIQTKHDETIGPKQKLSIFKKNYPFEQNYPQKATPFKKELFLPSLPSLFPALRKDLAVPRFMPTLRLVFDCQTREIFNEFWEIFENENENLYLCRSLTKLWSTNNTPRALSAGLCQTPRHGPTISSSERLLLFVGGRPLPLRRRNLESKPFKNPW